MEKSCEAAVEWYRRGVAKNYSQALKSLAVCYFHGRGVQKDMSEAERLLRIAANQSNSEAQFALGLLLSNNEPGLAEAIRWLRSSSKMNNAEALSKLSRCYLNGDGVERDLIMASCLLHVARSVQIGIGWVPNLEGGEKVLADAICAGTGDASVQSLALDWLCERNHNEVELLVRRRRAFHELVQVIETLPQPIAEEVIPSIVTIGK